MYLTALLYYTTVVTRRLLTSPDVVHSGIVPDQEQSFPASPPLRIGTLFFLLFTSTLCNTLCDSVK